MIVSNAEADETPYELRRKPLMAVTGKLFYLQTQTKASIRFNSEHRLKGYTKIKNER